MKKNVVSSQPFLATEKFCCQSRYSGGTDFRTHLALVGLSFRRFSMFITNQTVSYTNTGFDSYERLPV